MGEYGGLEMVKNGSWGGIILDYLLPRLLVDFFECVSKSTGSLLAVRLGSWAFQGSCKSTGSGP